MGTRGGILLLWIEQSGTAETLAFEDYQRDPFSSGDVVKRIPVDHREIGVVAGANRADAVGAGQAGGIPICGLQ
jgi:hypothetical protein